VRESSYRPRGKAKRAVIVTYGIGWIGRDIVAEGKIKLNVEQLGNGFYNMFMDLFEASIEDGKAEIKEHAEDLAVRAAKYTFAALAGDKDAETELKIIKGIAASVAAQINRRQAERIEAAIMQGIQMLMRFLVGALAAV